MDKDLRWRAYLLHLTHYDPGSLRRKKRERRFDRALAEELIRGAASAGFNMLIIDIKDAVAYRGLPGIRKPYTVPMRELRELTRLGRSFGMEVVPKLNFSKSNEHRHSAWLWKEQRPPDSPELWKQAMCAVDEVVAAVRPRFLHVGMDEDDTRSPDEYRKALHFLHRQLKHRGLRMMMWADCGHPWRPAERWKVLPVLKSLPRDVILMPWLYYATLEAETRQFMRRGFDVMGACMCVGPAKGRAWRIFKRNAREWLETMERLKGFGFVLTQWTLCQPRNRRALLAGIEVCRRLFAAKNGKNGAAPRDKRRGAK